jgi:hypothetical protein
MGMFARPLLATAILVAACSDGEPDVERDPNPAQAGEAGQDARAAQDDGAVRVPDAVVADSRTPNMVPYPACGGIAGLPCPNGEFCNQELPPDGLGCGFADSLGSCQSTVEACTETEPVCGCDGVTYESRCAAHEAGVSVKARNACKPDGELNCDERDVLCKRARPNCPEGQVPAVVESCWGTCTKLSECVCHAADECPERGRYVCHMSAQRCGPYVN